MTNIRYFYLSEEAYYYPWKL